MGAGGYSSVKRSVRASSLGYSTKSTYEIFKQKSINNAMNPRGVQMRESRDSEDHPESLSIVLGLDVTGSMGSVPHFLVKEGLPKIMSRLIEGQEKDPQALFLGIGDHECDTSPLQVGQFESSDELLDKWLTDVYLEGGGGGNGGESYLLAWYFAGFHTSTDCFEKRNRKGFLFTIGDEPTLRSIEARDIKDLMGDGEFGSYSAAELLDKARETYNVYHIHVKQTGAGSIQRTVDGWRELMGDNLLVVDRSTDIADVITKTILAQRIGEGVKEVEETVKENLETLGASNEEEIIL